MVSEKQQAANGANAQKGGVKTEEGRAIVRLNAVTHGLTSKEVLLRDEDEETLSILRQHLMSELQPEGEIETLLADLIVADTWRLRRAVKMETIYFQGTLEWITTLFEKQSPEEAMAKLRMAPAESIPWKLLAMEAMDERGGLLNLERYRTAIERHLYKSLHELSRMQAGRRGEKPSKTFIVGVDVSRESE